MLLRFVGRNGQIKSLSLQRKQNLSYDVASEREITPCNKIDKQLMVYRLSVNIMTSTKTLRT